MSYALRNPKRTQGGTGPSRKVVKTETTKDKDSETESTDLESKGVTQIYMC